MSDWLLLREYALRKSEPAFAQLVNKHMKLVYWTCWRGIGDAQLAEDATQSVFLLLAQKAGSVRSNVSIPGWLFNAARLVSRNVVRGERRRQRHEEKTAQETDHPTPLEPGWQEIEPWLNDALAILTPGEREVILMRYFDDLSYREIADQAGTTENAASTRAARAIDKMRRYLLSRGVTIASAALIGLLADHRSEAAPVSCQTSTMHAIHHLTIGQPTAASSHLALLHKRVYLTMQATKYKAIIAIAVLLLLIGGTVAWHHARMSDPAVRWNAPLAADPMALAAERQVHSQFKKFFDGYNAENTVEIETVLSPDCVIVYPVQRSMPLQFSQNSFMDAAPDGRLSATVNSFKVSGNTATIGVDLQGHHDIGTRSNNGPFVYRSSHQIIVVTFVETNGQWLMKRVDVRSKTLDPPL